MTRAAGYTPRERTRLMLDAEALAGKPLAEALPELLNQRGLRGTAEYLQVDPATLQYWCLRFGIQRKWVAIPRGYRLLLVPEEYLTPDVLRVPRIIAGWDGDHWEGKR